MAIGIWIVVGTITWIKSRETPSFLIFGYCYLFVGVIKMSLNQMDNMSKWDKTVHTLPVKRSDTVSVSYIISIQMVFAVVVINTFLSVVIRLCGIDITLTEWSCLLLKGIGIGLLPAALFYPLMIVYMNKTGNKPVISISVTFCSCMVLIGTTYLEEHILKPASLPFAVTYFSIGVALFVGSWLLSLKLIKQKDIY